MKRFNKTEYNVKRLQPREEDIELNKCTHKDIDENNKCICCRTPIELELDINDLMDVTSIIISYLESMKIIASGTFSKKEYKEAKKYFDMIPLLKNIGSLYNICSDINELYLKEEEEIDEEKAKFINLILRRSNDNNPLPVTIDSHLASEIVKYCGKNFIDECECDEDEAVEAEEDIAESPAAEEEVSE